jgi:hypothetical protein
LSEFTLLQNRVFELEEKVTEMQGIIGGSSVAVMAQRGAMTSSLPGLTPKQDLGSAQAAAGPSSINTANARGGGGEDDAVMMLEVSVSVGAKYLETLLTSCPAGLCHGESSACEKSGSEAQQ